MIWADRHGSIGYKLIGRLPLRRGGCPDLPKPGWTGEFEWEGTIPYEDLPEVVDPQSGFLVTANNRIVGDDYPHHITSDWLDGYRAKRIEELLREERRARHRGLRGDAGGQLLDPGPGGGAAARAADAAPASASCSAIERLRSWDGRLDPDSIAGTIYQAFLLRLAREVARAAIGDRDLCRALARPGRQRLHPARHLALALAFAPDEALGGGRRGADRPALGRARARGAAPGRSTTSPTASAPTPRAGAGAGSTRWSSRTRSATANPLLRRLLNRRLRAGRRPGDGQPDRLRPERPLQGRLGAELADGRRPGRARALALADVHRPVGPPGKPALRRPAGRLARGPDPADGRRGAVVGAGARARSPDRQRQAAIARFGATSSGPSGFPGGVRLAKAISIFALLAIPVTSPPGGGRAPRGFFGIAPQAPLGRRGYVADAAGRDRNGAGAGASGAAIQSSPSAEFNWDGLDEFMTLTAAPAPARSLPFFCGHAAMASGNAKTVLPVSSGRQRRAWSEFVTRRGRALRTAGRVLARALRPRRPSSSPRSRSRPGRSGTSPTSSISRPRPPRAAMRACSRSPTGRSGGRTAARRRSRGGLFGDPKPGPAAGNGRGRLPRSRLYRVRGVKATFDGIALHPYAADTPELRGSRGGPPRRRPQPRPPRRPVPDGDRLGLAARPGPGRLRGRSEGAGAGAAARLRLPDLHRHRLNLKQVDWFSWKDQAGDCNFCDSVGLFRRGLRFRPKPAWHVFVRVARGGLR